MLTLFPGSTVFHKGVQHTVVDLSSATQILVEDSEGNRSTLPVSDIQVRAEGRSLGDLAALDPEYVRKAQEALRLVRLLASAPQGQRSVEQVDQVATLMSKSRATIYRWLAKYEPDGSIAALMRKRRADLGGTRLEERVETIVAHWIDTYFLTLNRPSVASTVEKIRKACLESDLPPPHADTVADRIRRLDPAEVERRRYGAKRASEKFSPRRGSFPNADYPLAVAQMDHTPMDVIVVDDHFRKPIGRPYLSLLLDVKSKMVLGFYISLDPPGALSTGLALTHAMLGKEAFLASIGLSDLVWPCWGKMRTLHTDNAREFRGTMLGLACDLHGIIPERRPKGQPQYGGHIERSFRTFMSKVHELPGTTFSSVHDKVDYDSESKAVMTLRGLIKWFTIFIVGYYHQKPHEGNDGIPPIRVWEDLLINGTDDQPAMGIPSPVADPQKLRMDFLPYFLATIQEYGIQQWKLHWYVDALRRFIHAKRIDKPNAKRKFICRYDPRDLSHIWVYDEHTRTYITVSFRDKTRPAVSLWEVRQARKEQLSKSKQATNEELIFQAIDRMRQTVDDEAEMSKKARRQQQRQRDWASSRKTGAKDPPKAPPAAQTQHAQPPSEDFPGFDDIREA